MAHTPNQFKDSTPLAALETYIKVAEARAEGMKPTVDKIMAAFDKEKDPVMRSFVSIIAPSGTGKTQLAFAMKNALILAVSFFFFFSCILFYWLKQSW